MVKVLGGLTAEQAYRKAVNGLTNWQSTLWMRAGGGKAPLGDPKVALKKVQTFARMVHP